MPKVKIFINKSFSGDLKHIIYKFKNESVGMNTVDIINTKEPLATINEVNSSTVKKKRKIKLTSKREKDQTELFSKYEFIDSNTVINIYMSNSSEERKYEITVNNNLVSVVKLNGSVIDPKNFTIVDNRTIILKEGTKEESSFFVSYSADVIVYEDLDVDGIFTPKVKMLTNNKERVFFVENKDRKNTYTYMIAAQDITNKTSAYNDFFTIDVKETDETLNIETFANANSPSESERYVKIATNKLDDDIRYNLKDLTLEKAEYFNEWDIAIDDGFIRQKRQRTVLINNVFHPSFKERFERGVSSVKFKIKSENKESEFGDAFDFFEREEILLDGVVVLFKDVTSLSEEDRKKPLISSSDLLSYYVRKGSKRLDNLVEPSTTLYNLVEYCTRLCENPNNGKTKEVTLDSKNLFFEEKHEATVTKTYNYTVYTYDEEGVFQSPIVKVV